VANPQAAEASMTQMDRPPPDAPARDPRAAAPPEEQHLSKRRAGLRRLVNASRHSAAGFAAALRHEDAFRQELIAAAVLIPIAFLLDVGGVGKAMMIASVLLVLIVELLNSAIEAVVDRISLERHHLSRRAKDIGSAAVCLSLVNVAAVWVLVLVG